MVGLTDSEYAMPSSKTSISAQIDIARNLIANYPFDVEAALAMLSAVPTDLDLQTRGSIRHAQHVITDAFDESSARVALARFALARVITLLEQHVSTDG